MNKMVTKQTRNSIFKCQKIKNILYDTNLYNTPSSESRRKLDTYNELLQG